MQCLCFTVSTEEAAYPIPETKHGVQHYRGEILPGNLGLPYGLCNLPALPAKGDHIVCDQADSPELRSTRCATRDTERCLYVVDENPVVCIP